MSTAVLESQSSVMIGYWDYKAPATPELDKIVGTLSAMNHYVYVAIQDAEHRGIDQIVMKKCLAKEFDVDQSSIHSRLTSAKSYIDSGKRYRPYVGETPDTFEQFTERHFGHCVIGKDSYSITDHRNMVYIEVNNLLASGIRFKDALAQLADDPSIIDQDDDGKKKPVRDRIALVRNTYRYAVDYYHGLSNSPLFSRYYDVEQHGKPKEVTVGVQAPIISGEEQPKPQPDIQQIVAQITSGAAKPSFDTDVQPVTGITEDSKPTDMADIVLSVITECNHYKREAEKYKADAEHYKGEYDKLSAEMLKLKMVLAEAGYAFLVK